jgi:hypothetical protein
LRGIPISNPANIFNNNSGGLFSQNTLTASPNPANIFNNNSGGLFSQNTLTASPIPIPNFMTQTSNNLFGSN